MDRVEFNKNICINHGDFNIDSQIIALLYLCNVQHVLI